MSVNLVRTCPSCGAPHEGEPYDIGNGPEVCCATCDWCWGVEGQRLTPLCVTCATPLGPDDPVVTTLGPRCARCWTGRR